MVWLFISFHFLNGANAFKFDEVQFIYFLIYDFCVLRNLCLPPFLWKYLTIFSLRSFILLPFIFGPIILVKFSFKYDGRSQDSIFFLCEYPIVQHYFWKKLFFPFKENQLTLPVWYFSGLCSFPLIYFSIFMHVVHSLDYCSFIANLEIS